MFGNLTLDFLTTSLALWILETELMLSPLAIAKSVGVQVLCLLLIVLKTCPFTQDKSSSGLACRLNEIINDNNNINLSIFPP